MKSKRVVPTRKPAGSAACDASHARCALRSGNERFVLGTREKWQAAAESEEEFSPRKKIRALRQAKIFVEMRGACA
jgi:hypothetical protein